MSSRFGLLLHPRFQWPELLKQAKTAEHLAFRSLWLADQFVNPFEETDWHEAWTMLAALATATNHIRVGTLVTSIVYRHPAVVAKQAVTVDHISGGRLDLGIGAGGAPGDHRMTGTPFWPGRERQDRLAEFVGLVDQLLRDERSSYQGRYYTAEDVLMRPASVQRPRPPLIIAAHGPRSLRLAAEYADTWSFYEPGAGLVGEDALARVREMNRAIDERASVIGRDPRTITRSLCCGYSKSSAWRTLDEALTGIEQFEEAGINEFVFTYLPGVTPNASDNAGLEVSLGTVESPALLRSESALHELSDALRL